MCEKNPKFEFLGIQVKNFQLKRGKTVKILVFYVNFFQFTAQQRITLLIIPLLLHSMQQLPVIDDYFAGVISGEGECFMNPKQVNVLSLPQRPNFTEPSFNHSQRHWPSPTLSDIADADDAENELEASAAVARNSTRRKRQSSVIITPEAITDNEGKTRQVVTLASLFITY